MPVYQSKLARFTPNLGIFWISICSFWPCGSIVANPIIYRLVPSPSRYEIRQRILIYLVDSVIQHLNNRGLYFHVVLFIVLYKVALSFKSVYEAIVCDQRLLSSTSMNWVVYFSAQGADLLPVVDPMQNLFAQTIHLYRSGFDRSLYFELQTN